MPTQVSRITNYATLQQAIGDWLDRSDLTTVIPTFIQLAEGQINQRLRHWSMIVKATAPGTANDPEIKLPTNWLEARNVEVDDYQLKYESPDVLDMYRNENPTPDDDQPLIYSYYGSVLEVWPTPTEAFTVEMDYYERVPIIADQVSGTNWLLTLNPAVYLYGSLIHSAVYLRDDQRVALWDKLFTEELAVLNMQSTRAMTSGSRITRSPSVSFG